MSESNIPVPSFPLVTVSVLEADENGCRSEMEAEISTGCWVAGRPQASVRGRVVWRFLIWILDGASSGISLWSACGVRSGGIVVPCLSEWDSVVFVRELIGDNWEISKFTIWTQVPCWMEVQYGGFESIWSEEEGLWESGVSMRLRTKFRWLGGGAMNGGRIWPDSGPPYTENDVNIHMQ